MQLFLFVFLNMEYIHEQKRVYEAAATNVAEQNI